MANQVLTPDVIAKECLLVLDNELVMAKKIHRAHENEFSKEVNGYQIGRTVSIKRPADFTVRQGRVASSQDVVQGSTTLTIDKQNGIDFEFTSGELTLDIKDLSESVIKPAMIQLANHIDRDCQDLFYNVPSWVGTAGQTIDSFSDLAKAPERLDEYAVPQDSRCATLSPADHWALAGSQTALFNNSINGKSYRNGAIGMIGGVDTYMTQNVPTLTTGTRSGSILVDQALTDSTISYLSVKDSMTQTLHIDSFAGATQTVKKGEVFTVAGVYAVNPVTKERLPFLKQFTVMEDATAANSEVDLSIYPAMIWTGAFQNISTDATDLNNAAITFIGSASSNYRQNMVFHKNAFALAMVPMEMPQGAVGGSRQSYKGLSVRLQPYYDGTNDISKWRLDVLYGVKAIDPRLATRISGS